MTLEQIVSTVLREMDVPFRFVLRRRPVRRGYCVQYQESDYAFVTRLCAEDGVYFFLEPPAPDFAVVEDGPASSIVGAAAETVVFADTALAYPPIAGASDDGVASASVVLGTAGSTAVPAPLLPFRPADGGWVVEGSRRLARVHAR